MSGPAIPTAVATRDRPPGPGRATGARRASRALRVVLSAFALLTWATLACADYRVNFRTAVLAIDGQRWSEAVMYLNMALKENSTEGLEDVLITGTRVEPYLPLYYLGYAYYRMGDCARATGAWQLARMSGAVDDYPKLAKALRNGIETCDKSGGTPGETTDASGTTSPQKRAEIARLLKQADTELKARRSPRPAIARSGRGRWGRTRRRSTRSRPGGHGRGRTDRGHAAGERRA